MPRFPVPTRRVILSNFRRKQRTLGNASAGIRSLRPALSDGAAMPDELQQKMRNASLFNKGMR